MGGEGVQQQEQILQVAPGAAVGVQLVHHGHHSGDGGVHLQTVHILCDLLDGLVDDGRVLFGNAIFLRHLIGEVPHAV